MDLQRRIAELEQENTYLAQSNAALTRLLCEATSRITELIEERARPQLRVVHGERGHDDGPDHH